MARPAICREPAATPVHAGCQASSSRLILLPLRGRSSECGPEQARSYGLRPESKAANPPQSRAWPEGTHVMPGTALLLPGRRRSVARPAICREPAARPVHAGCQASSSRLILLPLRGRSSECGPEQARSYRDCVIRKFLGDRSHAPRGNAGQDALRPSRRGASNDALPRRAWERSDVSACERSENPTTTKLATSPRGL